MSDIENLVIWSRCGPQLRIAARCGVCGGTGFIRTTLSADTDCAHCAGLGWFGIDPRMPVMARPGSAAKIAVLTVRYVSGVCLFNDRDYNDREATTRRDVLERISALACPV